MRKLAIGETHFGISLSPGYFLEVALRVGPVKLPPVGSGE